LRVLILIDAKNFEKGVINVSKKRNEFRYIDFYKLNNFILGYLRKNKQYSQENLVHLRTYFYTGEYTDKLIDKIEKHLENNPKEADIIKNILERAKKEKEKQTTFFNYAKDYYFFEIKKKPLQFSYSDTKIIQKGVDVQIAVDLIDFTYKNIYDICVLLSGDIDLLESVKTAKELGKHIIIFGDSSVTAEEMKRNADFFIDVGRLKEEELNEFTHVPKNY